MGTKNCKPFESPQKLQDSTKYNIGKLYPIPNACQSKKKIDELKKYMPDSSKYKWIGLHPDVKEGEAIGSDWSIKNDHTCYYCHIKDGNFIESNDPLYNRQCKIDKDATNTCQSLGGYKGYFKKIKEDTPDSSIPNSSTPDSSTPDSSTPDSSTPDSSNSNILGDSSIILGGLGGGTSSILSSVCCSSLILLLVVVIFFVMK